MGTFSLFEPLYRKSDNQVGQGTDPDRWCPGSEPVCPRTSVRRCNSLSYPVLEELISTQKNTRSAYQPAQNRPVGWIAFCQATSVDPFDSVSCLVQVSRSHQNREVTSLTAPRPCSSEDSATDKGNRAHPQPWRRFRDYHLGREPSSNSVSVLHSNGRAGPRQRMFS